MCHVTLFPDHVTLILNSEREIETQSPKNANIAMVVPFVSNRDRFGFGIKVCRIVEIFILNWNYKVRKKIKK
jgi:hypothetical protein